MSSPLKHVLTPYNRPFSHARVTCVSASHTRRVTCAASHITSLTRVWQVAFLLLLAAAASALPFSPSHSQPPSTPTEFAKWKVQTGDQVMCDV